MLPEEYFSDEVLMLSCPPIQAHCIYLLYSVGRILSNFIEIT